MDLLANGEGPGALPSTPERLIRAASHGLGNELYVIRAYAELVILRDDVAPGARAHLSALIARVAEASSLLQHLSAAARAAASSPEADGLGSLASAMEHLLPREMACEGGSAQQSRSAQ